MLLSNGISPNSKDESGANALMLSASAGEVKVVKTLIKNGADINAQDKRGEENKLEIALSCKPPPQICSLFSNLGLDFSCAGRTALAGSVKAKQSATTKVLIDAGANVGIADEKGMDPLTFAVLTDQKEIVTNLLDNGASTDSEVPITFTSNPDLARYPISNGHRNGCDLEQNKEGKTPLHFAALSGTPDIVQLILSAGGSPRRKDYKGSTPADLAAGRKDQNIQVTLIKAGTNIQVQSMLPGRTYST